jgi:hypothetical protein
MNYNLPSHEQIKEMVRETRNMCDLIDANLQVILQYLAKISEEGE